MSNKKRLRKRVAALEKRVAELEARPAAETHHHYHGPSLCERLGHVYPGCYWSTSGYVACQRCGALARQEATWTFGPRLTPPFTISSGTLPAPSSGTVWYGGAPSIH